MKKLFCCPTLNLFCGLPLWKTILLSSFQELFCCLSPLFSCLALWKTVRLLGKKSYKMQQKKLRVYGPNIYTVEFGLSWQENASTYHHQPLDCYSKINSVISLMTTKAAAAASPPPPPPLRLAAPLSAAFLAPRRRNQTVFSGRRIARVTLHIVHKSQLMFRKCKSYQRVIPRPNFKILLNILIGKYVLLILMYPKVASNNPYYKSKICSKITVHKCQKSPS